ncbi:SH3 domain-containing protein [Terrisporobacter sp.]
MKFKSLVLAGVISGGMIFGSIAHPNISNAATPTAIVKTALNMRSRNSTDSKVLLKLNKDDTVTILQKMSNGWYKVKIGDKTGYVDQRYVTIVSENAKKVGTTKENLRMRSTNSTKGKVITTLKKGTKVEVLKKMSNGWYKVKHSGKTGYVSGVYLTVKDETVSKTDTTIGVDKNKVGTTKENLRMRSTNSTKGKIITTLKKGTKVEVLKKMSNGWYKVKHSGKTGYVSGTYLKVTSKPVVNINSDTTIKDKDSSSIVNIGTDIINKNFPQASQIKDGISSINALRKKLNAMGIKYDINTTYNFRDPKTNQLMGSLKTTNKGVYFTINAKSPEFNSALKKLFNTLLPTKGNDLYNVVMNAKYTQKFKMDGKLVTVTAHGGVVGVEIGM